MKKQNFIINNNNKQQEKIFLSASKINTFLSCPILYFLKYHTDIGDIDIVWPGNLFGQTLHKILEFIILHITQGTSHKDVIAQLHGLFTNTFLQLKKEAEDKKVWQRSRAYHEQEFCEKGEKYALMLANFLLKFFPKEYTILSEQKFVYPWLNDENVIITGVVDSIIKYDDKNYEIFDLKVTQFSEQYYFIPWHIMIQNLLYEYLTYKEYGEFALCFTYIVLNHNEKMLFLKQKIIKKPENIFSYFAYLNNIIIQIKQYSSMPNFTQKYYSDNCKFCAYKKYCEKL